VVELHALGIHGPGTLGEDAAPGYGHADAVDAEPLAELEVLAVAVVEVARRVTEEAPLLGEEVVPSDLPLAMGEGLALALVGGGGAAVDETFGESLH